MSRCRVALSATVALLTLAHAAGAGHAAGAAHPAGAGHAAGAGSVREIYRAIPGSPSVGSPLDTLGSGQYEAARRLFQAGDFDSAAAGFQQFARRFPRNLLVNDALEHVLLIREYRGGRESREGRASGDEPLRIYARAAALREAGLADSAATLLRTGLERFPAARIRYHWDYLLAGISRDKGDHATAIRYALAVADTTSRSRLAPYALKLAADETLAMGDDPAKALRLYQTLLERHPTSPLAPPVRARVLEIRKKLQL